MRCKQWLTSLGRHVLLAAGAVFMLLPFLWMLSTTLKGPDEIFATEIRFLPEKWFLIESGVRNWFVVENFREAFRSVPLLRFLLNNVIVTVAIFLLQVIIAVPCAYAMAKLRFPGRGVIFGMVLFGLLIPVQAVAIPIFVMFWKIGVLNTYAAMVLPWIISVFGIFLMRQFFIGIPDDLIYAARVDGMGDLAILARIFVPLSIPAIVAFGVFSFIAHWNDYFWPLIVVNDSELFTLPVGIAFFKNDEAGTNYGALMAAATFTITPLIAAYFMAQKWFIRGIAVQAGIK